MYSFALMRFAEAYFCVSLFCTVLLIWTFNEFYACTDLNETSWAMFVVDLYRITTTMVLAFVLFIDARKLFDSRKVKLLLNALFVGSLIVFLFHIIKIADSQSSNNCPMRKLDGDDWNHELLKVFPDFTCQLEPGEISTFDTMSNPHVMDRARNWCPDRVKKRCYNHRDTSIDIMHCLRNGATDFVHHLRYIYVFDLIGDASRSLAFLSLSSANPNKLFVGMVQQAVKGTTKTQKFRL